MLIGKLQLREEFTAVMITEDLLNVVFDLAEYTDQLAEEGKMGPEDIRPVFPPEWLGLYTFFGGCNFTTKKPGEPLGYETRHVGMVHAGRDNLIYVPEFVGESSEYPLRMKAGDILFMRPEIGYYPDGWPVFEVIKGTVAPRHTPLDFTFEVSETAELPDPAFKSGEKHV